MSGEHDRPEFISFGRFRILPDRRELLVDHTPIQLGAHAFDLLMAFVESPGLVLSKADLLTRAWPECSVTDGNLQGQISALRRAFGAERELIRTISGRGYQFTGEVRIVASHQDSAATTELISAGDGAVAPPTNLPLPFFEMIGRAVELEEVTSLVQDRRLVTLTGAGGIGKTRLALEVARRLHRQFHDGVWLVEFSPLADPRLVPATVAAAVGLEHRGELLAQYVAQALATRRMLLIFDTCEHVIDAAAAMAEAAVRLGSAVQVLATSREPLRVAGERLYQVAPLAVPPDDVVDIAHFGAARLFIDRARAAGAELHGNRSQVAAITTICRRLEGIPLAIEMAAARAATLGVEELVARFGGRYELMTGGRRTALPRHQTMRETINWSYELLEANERTILRRLAIFAGTFSLEAAAVVVADDDSTSIKIMGSISALVEKSLIVAELDGATPHYRLLDMTRSYALDRLVESGEYARTARRQAEYQRDVLAQTRFGWDTQLESAPPLAYGNQLDDVRAALDWAFSSSGDVSIGVQLTAHAAPLWLRLSLTAECGQHAERALRSLTDIPDPGRRYEMELQAALAISLYYTQGVVPEIASAFATTLEIAERLSDAEFQWQALYGLWHYYVSLGDHTTAATIGRRFSDLAAHHLAGPAIQLVGDRLIAVPLHFLGDLSGAQQVFNRLLGRPVQAMQKSHVICYQHDQRLEAQATLARILWLQGYPRQALQLVQEITDKARRSTHQMALGFTLIHTRFQVALFVGDLVQAEQWSQELLKQAATYGISYWRAHGIGARGMLMAKSGDLSAGLRLLDEALDGLSKIRFYTFHTMLQGAQAEALGALGLVDEGWGAIEGALGRAARNKERWYLPELLRIKGALARKRGGPAADGNAEQLFGHSLDEALRLGALSWQLRTAVDLAQLLIDQHRCAAAAAALHPVYRRFTEGFDTGDLKAAKVLLCELGQP